MHNDWTHPVRIDIEQGYILKVRTDGVSIWQPSKESCGDFGFNVERSSTMRKQSDGPIMTLLIAYKMDLITHATARQRYLPSRPITP